MPTILFIENTVADLNADTQIALTFQIHNLNSLESRQGNYSNEFMLPLTVKNQQLLGWPNIIQNQSGNIYKKTNSTLLINGVQNVPGFLIVESTTSNAAKCTFYCGNTNFFEALGEATLNNLNLAEHDHYWGLGGINNVFTNKANATGFVYPIIELSNDANSSILPFINRTVNPKLLRPAIFGSAILNAIGEYTGYTITGNFIADERFLNEIILVTNDELTHSDEWNDSQLFWVNKDADQTITAGDTDKVTFAIETEDEGNNFSNPDYTIPATGKYVFNCNYRFSVAGIDSPMPIIKIVKENPLGEKQTLAQATITTLFMVFPEDLTTGTIEAEQGDKVYVEIIAGANNATFLTDVFGGTFSCDFISETLIGYNNTFEFTGNLPDISLKNYIKALCQRYNLLIYTDELSKTVEFIPFKTIYQNMPFAVDWTNKLNITKQEIEFHPENYGQTNVFNYAATGKNIETLGEGVFNVNDQTLKNKAVTVTQPFAPTPMVTRLNGLDVPHVKLLKYNADTDDYKPQNNKPCILYLNRKLLDEPITYDDGTSTASNGDTHEPLAWFILPDMPYNLGFNNSLLADNYSELGYTLTKYKKLTALFNLTAADVMGFDFKRPVYLKQYAAYFYLNAILNYLPQKLTKVELIRM